jgi:hypothetical protein
MDPKVLDTVPFVPFLMEILKAVRFAEGKIEEQQEFARKFVSLSIEEATLDLLEKIPEELRQKTEFTPEEQQQIASVMDDASFKDRFIARNSEAFADFMKTLKEQYPPEIASHIESYVQSVDMPNLNEQSFVVISQMAKDMLAHSVVNTPQSDDSRRN